MEGPFEVFSKLVNLVKEPQKSNLAIRFFLLKFIFLLWSVKINFVKNAASLHQRLSVKAYDLCTEYEEKRLPQVKEEK